MGATGVALLETKLRVPRRRPGLVARARLRERLVGDLPSLVLVSAPAGFGKTTLLTEWVEGAADAAAHTAWVSLDRRDSDPSLFWSYVLAALRAVVPDVGTVASEMLRSSPGGLENVVGSLLNDLSRLEDELLLVLDDYHLIESLEVHESMRFFVDHLPAQIHLVISTRADPPWPLGGLRARGRLRELRAGDLRFTKEETAAYLTGSSGLDLTPTDVEALESRTEGWIAALQLAALSLHGHADPSAFIAQFAGDDRFVVDFLVDEVLGQQPAAVRDFLVETSILSRMSAPLCEAVTGVGDARSMLDVLERSNLFVVALDDRRHWYRYHHLFGDVLRARLAADQAHRQAELHGRASVWFEQDGDASEAIRHAMAARDFARAAELIEGAIPALRQSRQDATQREWLEALPDDVFGNRPVLNLARVGARMVTGDTAGVEALLTDVEAWIDGDRPEHQRIVHDHKEFARLPAQAAMYRAALALLSGDLVGTIAHAQRTAGLCAADDHLGRGAAAALIGLAKWADGDLEDAARGYETSIDEFDAAGFFADILGCSLALADIRVAQGRLRDAERTLDAGLDLAAAHGPLRGSADMHVGLAEVHFERNELDAASEHLRLSREAGEWLALAQHAYRSRVVDARLRAAAGDHAGAMELLREAQQLYDTDFSPKSRPVAATLARACLAAGDLAGVDRWLTDSGVTVDDDLTYLREYEHLTFAHVLLATGRHTDAVPLLQRLLAAAEAGGRCRSAIEAGLLLAVAHLLDGATSSALPVLEVALQRAEEEHVVRVFLDLGSRIIPLLEAALRAGVASAQVSVLLEAMRRVRPADRRAGLVDPLSHRELDILRLLRTELTGPQIAAELVVSVNTVRTHTKHIFTKLGVTNRRAAVNRADELGL